MRILEWNRIRKWLLVFSIITMVLSCTKEDQEKLITYEGRVFIYAGPYIPFISQVDDSELSFAADVRILVIESGPCVFNHCEERELADQVVTDAMGNYSFTIESRVDRYYYVRTEFPENVGYSTLRGSRKENGNRIVFQDIILAAID